MVEMINEEYNPKKVDAQTLVCMWLRDTIDDMRDTIESFDNGSATMELLQRNMGLTGIDLPKGVDPVDIKFTMEDTLNRLVAIYNGSCPASYDLSRTVEKLSIHTV